MYRERMRWFWEARCSLGAPCIPSSSSLWGCRRRKQTDSGARLRKPAVQATGQLSAPPGPLGPGFSRGSVQKAKEELCRSAELFLWWLTDGGWKRGERIHFSWPGSNPQELGGQERSVSHPKGTSGKLILASKCNFSPPLRTFFLHCHLPTLGFFLSYPAENP